jgi:hypothetical protein
MPEYVFAGCTVIVDEEHRYLETWFPDGTRVPAAPNYDAASIERAHDLGYEGDTWAMTRDHELAHSWLAVTSGLGQSPTLWHLAHPEAEPLGEHDVNGEEARVLRFQRTLSKPGPRPWDVAQVDFAHES